MSVRDVIAAAIWLYEREIAGAPLPHPSWETFKKNDPETAMLYETHAGSVDAALRAAGYVVVPVEATDGMCIAATARNDRGENRDTDAYGLYRTIYRAMIAAAETSQTASASPKPRSAPE